MTTKTTYKGYIIEIEGVTGNFTWKIFDGKEEKESSAEIFVERRGAEDDAKEYIVDYLIETEEEDLHDS